MDNHEQEELKTTEEMLHVHNQFGRYVSLMCILIDSGAVQSNELLDRMLAHARGVHDGLCWALGHTGGKELEGALQVVEERLQSIRVEAISLDDIDISSVTKILDEPPAGVQAAVVIEPPTTATDPTTRNSRWWTYLKNLFASSTGDTQ